MHTLFSDKEISYTGAELRSHFIYDRFYLLGDALVGFAGPCSVSLKNMVDLEDVKEKRPIYSEKMLHFLGEHFGVTMDQIVLRQRLLVAIIFEEFLRRGVKNLRRVGDDLYEEKAKWSVSIATLSPISGVIHTGINISSLNTPVLTKGLNDYQIDVPDFAHSILKAYAEEMHSITKARCKVRAVP